MNTPCIEAVTIKRTPRAILTIPDGECFWKSFHGEIFPRLYPMCNDITAAYGLLDIVHKIMLMPGRYYHNSQHVLNMFQMAKKLHLPLSKEETLAILFHDVVYMPGDSGNEYNSSSMCNTICTPYIDRGIINKAMGIINATRRPCGEAELRECGSALVCDLDIAGMLNEETCLEGSLRIEEECRYFRKCDRKTFMEGRIKFIKTWSEEEVFFYSEAFAGVYCGGFGTTRIVNDMMKKVLKGELSRCRGILGHLRK